MRTTVFGKGFGAAVVSLALCSVPLMAQSTGAVPPGPGSDAPKPPAYVPQGPPPPSTDSVPAPTAPAQSQADRDSITGPSVTPPGSTAPEKWNTDQILTATVHQAWLLAGKNEDNFFQIVKQLAEISAQNRGLVLPDTPEAGRKAGEYIKTHAKADHNALLYPIVDKAVQMTGKPEGTATANAGQAAH